MLKIILKTFEAKLLIISFSSCGNSINGNFFSKTLLFLRILRFAKTLHKSETDKTDTQFYANNNNNVLPT